MISQAWLEASSDEESDQLFSYFNKLGTFESVDDINWSGCVNNKSTSGSLERCNYNVSASYENGSASIYFGLSLESEEIKIMQLQVNSNAFMQQ